MYRTLRLSFALFLALLALASASRLTADVRAGYPGETAISASDIKKDVEFLSADDKEGRKTAGGILEGVCSSYLEAELKRLNLEPAGEGGTYRQPWRYRSWNEDQLAGFAPRSLDAHDDHDHDNARFLADGSQPADIYGVKVNEQGLAFTPGGEAVSIEPVDEIPLMAPAEPNTHNLIAKIRGSTKPDEYIVLGAHMDHVGKSSWGGGDRIYNGADDNASGTSTLLAVARALAAARDQGRGPARSVLICWFSGEELGLLGSQYYVGKPTVPLASIKAMLNVDMTGRQGPNQVSVGDRAPAGMQNLLHELHDAEGLGFAKLDHNIESYITRSDQYSFLKKGIPVIFFFEGLSSSGGINPDYHRVSDSADKIDFDKSARIGRLMFRHVMAVANHP
jgi:hypothetical protein